MELKLAFVDNEAQILDTLKNYCDIIALENKIKISCKFFDNAFDFLENSNLDYDCVFLDIQMPQMSGIECAHKIREIDKNIDILFITNHPQYAIEGYKVNAMDYLLKPIQLFDFRIEINKIIDKKPKTFEFLLVRSHSIRKRIYTKDIKYLTLNNHDVTIVTVGGDITFRGTMKEFEEKLDPTIFSRCNSCYLINLAYVYQIENDVVEIEGGQKLEISRNRKKQFLDEFTMFLNR